MFIEIKVFKANFISGLFCIRPTASIECPALCLDLDAISIGHGATHGPSRLRDNDDEWQRFRQGQ